MGSTTLWERQKAFYSNKYEGLRSTMQGSISIDAVMAQAGCKDLKEAIKQRGSQFDSMVNTYMRSANVLGRNICVAYAAAVSLLLDNAGVGYTPMAGACMPKSAKQYDKCRKELSTATSEGKKHPLVMNHVFIHVNADGGYDLEYAHADEEIDHMDCIPICCD